MNANTNTRRHRALAGPVLLLIALTATACVDSGDPDVRVDQAPAELVFGVGDLSQEETAAAAPRRIVRVIEDAPLPLEVAPPPPAKASPPKAKYRGPRYVEVAPPPYAREECLTGDHFYEPAPERELVPDVATLSAPLIGTMRWNRQERYTERGVEPDEDAWLPLPPVTRLIPKESIEQTEKGSFSYRVFQPLEGNRFLVTTYFVTPKQAATVDFEPQNPDKDKVQPPLVAAAVGVPISGLFPGIHPPEPGVFLARTEVVDAGGNPVSDTRAFTPATGLMLIPLEVEDGTSWISSATDPESGKSVRLEGDVIGGMRVNACGDPIDGFLVSATVTITDPAARNAAGEAAPSDQYLYRYVLAPQYGGMIVAEQTSKVTPGGLAFTLHNDTPVVSTPRPAVKDTQAPCYTAIRESLDLDDPSAGPAPTTSTSTSTTTTSTTTTTTIVELPSTTTTQVDTSALPSEIEATPSGTEPCWQFEEVLGQITPGASPAALSELL